MEFGLHHAHVGARLHSHDDIVEKALTKDARSGRGIGQPDGVIHIVSPLVQTLATHHANDQERCASNEYILTQRIRSLGEQVLYYGLTNRDDLSIALTVRSFFSDFQEICFD
ncbi:hypothetical protein CCP4SC76_2510004 [Gammaproteobacteria bacterium]